MATDASIPYTELTYQIIGCAMAVHNELGPGLKEKAYQRALSVRLSQAGLSFEEEKVLRVRYDGVTVGRLFVDHVVEGAVLVEEKDILNLLTNDEVAQVITYVAASGLPVGLLLNFGRGRLQYKRILPPKNIEAWRDRIRRYARPNAS